MRGLHVSVIALVWAAAPPLQLPIPTPDKSPWEMTFVEVEELAGLPPLATAPRDTQELRVMHRPWSAMAPVPFLRVFRVDDVLRAEFFVFGGPSYQRNGLSVDRPNTRCSPPGGAQCASAASISASNVIGTCNSLPNGASAGLGNSSHSLQMPPRFGSGCGVTDGIEKTTAATWLQGRPLATSTSGWHVRQRRPLRAGEMSNRWSLARSYLTTQR